MRLIVFSLFLLTILRNVVSQTSGNNFQQPSVTIPQGKILGELSIVPNHGEVKEFLGVPYAKPPLGDLRLKPPEQVMPSEEYNATEYKAACLQEERYLEDFDFNDEFNKDLSEDCLYLNIYVPVSDIGNLPVMVFIHGGGFFIGSGSSYNGRVLAAKGKVIVVTINYRLGLLGFFPNGGPESTLGLQDQIMALKWVKTSISSFGGDPNQVTIFGESAGGASVDFLSRSPKARGLFQRVISQSGVATSPWALNFEEGKDRMDKLTNLFREGGCLTVSIANCVKQATVQQIVDITSQMGMTTPQIDNDIIMEDYATNTSLIHPGLEFIMGTQPNEGAMLVYIACSSISTAGCDSTLGVTFENLVSFELFPSDIEGFSDTLVAHYNSWYPVEGPLKPGNLNLEAATNLGTDAAYKVWTNVTASRLSGAGFKVRVYEFNAVSEFSRMPATSWSSEAQHADELPFVFGMPKNGSEEKVANSVIKLWTDFAKGRLSEETWPRFTTQHGEYLYIDLDHAHGHVKMPYFAEYKNPFWRNYLDYGVFPPFIQIPTASSGRININLIDFSLMVILATYMIGFQ